ncbi:hypothetical protein [Dyella tabacisoli]|uniref:Uncharacterized protein n=1 Tax=Dyella tabacisoli TaxID=2282381 RepID=A0A369ULH1_9GAMM|nr:hypothetical protein [Dyella tabacisoli]RDD81357.1 hypothetical protein DVJ77_13810 [Dyella tabacisoli]
MSENNRPPISRTHYFSGESLLTADFECEQQYNMEMLALLNSSLRTWGIATGLEVSWQAGSQSNQVTVSAGMAIDQLGRQIVLTAARVLKLDGVPVGSTVYLTIRYHEVYADYTVESGVPGYKRIVQQPVLEYLRTLQEPGINILLAVVNFSSQGGINTLTFKSGQFERRYVGSRLGVLELVTEGSGINQQAGTGIDDTAGQAWSGIELKAIKESSGLADYMEVQAHRSHFTGMLTTRGNLGIGVDQPQANLQVERITSKGVGKLVTQGKLLTLQIPIYPLLQPGDIVTPELPVGAAPLQPRQAVIESATSDPGGYQIAQAFQEDLLLPCSYSYIRATLASFSAGAVGQLLRIDGDGTVGLGVQSAVQSGKAGPAALKISSSRSVGIALDTDIEPRATLDVNGSLLADSFTCNGIVKAQSFQGNGSMLQNLPILSYWTKQNVASAYSAIYYNEGNVGVQMTDPLGSLSVGTGTGFIGAGSVSADATDLSKLIGTQTAFKTQVSLGDSIVLGSLMQQWQQIKTITSDLQLELIDQFPTIIQQSDFQYLPSGSAAIPGSAQLITPAAATINTVPGANAVPGAKPGTGTISSSGATVTGVGTQFTKDLKQGDWLMIAEFKPKTTPGNQNQWLVQKVIDDTHLQLINNTGLPIPANISAYMVAPALIGVFQSNAILTDDPPPPPAMLLVSNGSSYPPAQSNSIAINLTLDQLNPAYALQVNGDVDFSGTSTFDKLVANTLTVKQWASITGAGKDGTVLMVGPNDTTPLLSVTQSNVVIGVSTGKSLLEIGGDAHATGNLIAGLQLQAASANVTGLVSGGSLQANALSVSGVMVDASGNVTAIGSRTAINISTAVPVQYQQVHTDGFVVATLGPFDASTLYAGALSCETFDAGGSSTSKVYASASTTQIITSSGKHGTDTYNLQQSASLCVPVRNGETWRLVFTTNTSLIKAAAIEAYWVPLGPSNTQSTVAAAKPMAQRVTDAIPAIDPLHFIQAQRSRLTSNGLQPLSLSEAQREIDQRTVDLTQILGDATKMDAAPAARADFVKSLQKIVCSAAPPGTPLDNRVDPKSIADLIETFGQVTSRQYTAAEKALLDSAVRALVTINDNETNRNDINLIRTHINLFLQHLQKVTGITFDNMQLRLLTRALVRLVGNGTQDPAQVSGTQVNGDASR